MGKLEEEAREQIETIFCINSLPLSPFSHSRNQILREDLGTMSRVRAPEEHQAHSLKKHMSPMFPHQSPHSCDISNSLSNNDRLTRLQQVILTELQFP